MKRELIAAFCVLLLLSSAYAVIPYGTLKVFAVTEDGETAMTADLSLTIEKGTGHVWTDTEPLIGTSTQTTEKSSVQVAKNYFPSVMNYDYKFDINSSASVVDGPSAGAAMALLAISQLTDKPLPKDIGITGTITTEGGVGAVGGVFKKAQEAARIGTKLFMIPVGEAKQTVKQDSGIQSVDLSDYALKTWGMKVVEVANIDQVLALAFTDISAIDVNSGKIVLPDFIPGGIPVSGDLVKFRELTADYIKKAEDSLKTAKNSLSGTMLNNAGVVDVLLASLNNGEENLQNAKILLDQNYLYSAANYSFLAQVDADFVNDISNNPILVDSSNPGAQVALDLKINELKKKLAKIKSDLNSPVPVDKWELFTAAQQRLSWAQRNVNALSDNTTIVVQVGGGTSDNTLKKIQDYEFAVAWANVAEDFEALATSSGKTVLPKPVFQEPIDGYISSAEKLMQGINPDDLEDIQRRIDSAKLEKANGWNTAALLDAASAFAIANSDIFIKDKDLNALNSNLKQKISELDSEMSSDNSNFVWAKLYLDHAKYYSQGVDFYLGHGLNSQALDMAQGGTTLVFLADELYAASKEANDYFQTLPAQNAPQNPIVNGIAKSAQNPITLILLAIIAIIAIAMIIMFFVMKGSSKISRTHSEDIQESKKRLDKMLAEKKISYDKYLQVNSVIEKRMHELAFDRQVLSSNAVKADRLGYELQAIKKTGRQIGMQEKAGIITGEDFRRSIGKMQRAEASIQKKLAERKKTVAFEKEKIQKEKKEFGKEANSLIKGAKEQKTKKWAAKK